MDRPNIPKRLRHFRNLEEGTSIPAVGYVGYAIAATTICRRGTASAFFRNGCDVHARSAIDGSAYRADCDEASIDDFGNDGDDVRGFPVASTCDVRIAPGVISACSGEGTC
ncbi:hypothetical protein HDU96_005342 [Phlyctochytrium bullatum]|nr:hypothetical protein HDU96_005342 [Phlyctochytrium bullatum]